MIYVDADACPVKTEIEQVATRLNVVVKMVCNGGIRPPKNPLIDLVVVDAGPDLADMWIANHAKTGDVVITTDIPLAAKVLRLLPKREGTRCVSKGGRSCCSPLL